MTLITFESDVPTTTDPSPTPNTILPMMFRFFNFNTALVPVSRSRAEKPDLVRRRAFSLREYASHQLRRLETCA